MTANGDQGVKRALNPPDFRPVTTRRRECLPIRYVTLSANLEFYPRPCIVI